jgi:hypothetical protein
MIQFLVRAIVSLISVLDRQRPAMQTALVARLALPLELGEHDFVSQHFLGKIRAKFI